MVLHQNSPGETSFLASVDSPASLLDPATSMLSSCRICCSRCSSVTFPRNVSTEIGYINKLLLITTIVSYVFIDSVKPKCRANFPLKAFILYTRAQFSTSLNIIYQEVNIKAFTEKFV